MSGQIELFAIDNPCVGVCETNKKGYCIGCLRSRDERAKWYQMSDEQKRVVLRLLALRHKKLAKPNQDRQLSMDFSPMVGELWLEFYVP